MRTILNTRTPNLFLNPKPTIVKSVSDEAEVLRTRFSLQCDLCNKPVSVGGLEDTTCKLVKWVRQPANWHYPKAQPIRIRITVPNVP